MAKLRLDPTKLKTARGNRTQAQVADLLGVTLQSISAYERGVATPPLDKALQLCVIYGVQLDQMLFTPKKI